MEALEEYGALLFRDLHIGDDAQVAFGRRLLADLIQRATTPDRVFRHTWSVGDMVIWDNRGLVHRACPFDRREPRRMHRTTLVGDEAIR